MRDCILLHCRREISVCWYEGAKNKMSAEQLQSVRRKIKGALGELPPEIAKDDVANTPETTEAK